MNLHNTAQEKPEYRKDVLIWHPGAKCWAVALLYRATSEFGDYFSCHGTGGWYLIEGDVYWFDLPESPEAYIKEWTDKVRQYNARVDFLGLSQHKGDK